MTLASSAALKGGATDGGRGPGYAGLAGACLWLRIGRARHGGGAATVAKIPRQERDQWRMPPLALLKPVIWSPALKPGNRLG